MRKYNIHVESLLKNANEYQWDTDITMDQATPSLADLLKPFFWDLSSYSSGVYLARADSGTSNWNRFLPVPQ